MMRQQRPPHLPPTIDGSAFVISLDDKSVAAAMAVLTIHHWPDRHYDL
ncbi:MAG: hypothetical protein H7061_00650 [Bdellovibrionaceae bacterium]|nr:hypothetical protein [Bdellovibrio sp.]